MNNFISKFEKAGRRHKEKYDDNRKDNKKYKELSKKAEGLWERRKDEYAEEKKKKEKRNQARDKYLKKIEKEKQEKLKKAESPRSAQKNKKNNENNDKRRWKKSIDMTRSRLPSFQLSLDDDEELTQELDLSSAEKLSLRELQSLCCVAGTQEHTKLRGLLEQLEYEGKKYELENYS